MNWFDVVDDDDKANIVDNIEGVNLVMFYNIQYKNTYFTQSREYRFI